MVNLSSSHLILICLEVLSPSSFSQKTLAIWEQYSLKFRPQKTLNRKMSLKNNIESSSIIRVHITLQKIVMQMPKWNGWWCCYYYLWFKDCLCNNDHLTMAVVSLLSLFDGHSNDKTVIYEKSHHRNILDMIIL